MLEITRRREQGITIGGNIVVKVVSINHNGTQCRLGIEAPRAVPVDRAEIRRIKNARANRAQRGNL